MVLTGLLPCLLPAEESTPAPKVLIYTRNHVTNGKGYVHDNIATSVAAVKDLCAAKGVACDASDDPAVFTADNLKNYRAVVFSNSNNEAFSDPAQSKAFTTYIENGGGFVGIHSASGSERSNPDFNRILGGTYTQITTPFAAAPAWKWKDEGYLCDLVPDLHVLLEMDTTTIANPPRDKWVLKFEGNRFPLSWCHQVGKGRCFYTALGHDKEDYADPQFRSHIQGGILWVLNLAN